MSPGNSTELGKKNPVYTCNSSIVDILLSHTAHLFLHAVFMFMINYIKKDETFFGIYHTAFFSLIAFVTTNLYPLPDRYV